MALNEDKKVKDVEEELKIADQLKQLGNDDFNNKRFRHALTHYESAIKNLEEIKLLNKKKEINDNLLKLYSNVSICYLKLEEFENAIINSTKVLSIDKSNRKALYRRGLCYRELRDFDKASVDISKLQKLCNADDSDYKLATAELEKIDQLSKITVINGGFTKKYKAPATKLMEVWKDEKSLKGALKGRPLTIKDNIIDVNEGTIMINIKKYELSDDWCEMKGKFMFNSWKYWAGFSITMGYDPDDDVTEVHVEYFDIPKEHKGAVRTFWKDDVFDFGYDKYLFFHAAIKESKD